MIEDPLAGFLHALMNDGQVAVTPEPLGPSEARVFSLLERLDRLARAEAGLECPTLLPAAAHWAARLVYHLCQFTVCRDIDETQIRTTCAEACPEPRSPETDWSVDLLFRHLPRVYRAAAHLSPSDPLLVQLRRIAAGWPLSSVGIPDLGTGSIESFIGHPALRRLYADRIANVSDASRLGDPRVEAILRADLGLHPELAPELSRRLTATS